MVECRKASPLHLPLRDLSKIWRALNYNSTREELFGNNRSDLSGLTSSSRGNFICKLSTNFNLKRREYFFLFWVFPVNNKMNLCCRMFLRVQQIRTRLNCYDDDIRWVLSWTLLLPSALRSLFPWLSVCCQKRLWRPISDAPKVVGVFRVFDHQTSSTRQPSQGPSLPGLCPSWGTHHGSPVLMLFSGASEMFLVALFSCNTKVSFKRCSRHYPHSSNRPFTLATNIWSGGILSPDRN